MFRHEHLPTYLTTIYLQLLRTLEPVLTLPENRTPNHFQRFLIYFNCNEQRYTEGYYWSSPQSFESQTTDGDNHLSRTAYEFTRSTAKVCADTLILT